MCKKCGADFCDGTNTGYATGCDVRVVQRDLGNMRTAIRAAIVQLENNCPNTQVLTILRAAVQEQEKK